MESPARCNVPGTLPPARCSREGRVTGATRLCKDVGLSLSPAFKGLRWASPAAPGTSLSQSQVSLPLNILFWWHGDSSCWVNLFPEMNPGACLPPRSSGTWEQSLGCPCPSRVCGSRQLSSFGILRGCLCLSHSPWSVVPRIPYSQHNRLVPFALLF